MSEIILKNNAGALAYTYPHTEFAVQIEGAVASPIASGGTGGAVTYIPIIAPKGVTNKYMYFNGSNAYNAFLKEFGVQKVSKGGQVFATAEEHLINGGNLLTINLRPDDAKMSNVTAYAVMKPTTKTIYINDVELIVKGALVNSDDVTDWTPLVINTWSVMPIFVSTAGISSPEELELAVNQATKMDLTTEVLLPLGSFYYKGPTKYGNNYELVFEPNSSVANGFKLYNLTVFDRAADEVIDAFTVTHARDVYVSGIPKSMVDVINTFSADLSASYYPDLVDNFNSTYIQMLSSIRDQLVAASSIPGGGTTPPDTSHAEALTPLITYLGKLLYAYESDDTATVLGGADIPALDIMEIFGQSRTAELNLVFNFEGQTPYTAKLANGTDGDSFANFRRFDFDYIYQEEGQIIVDLYEKAFSGFYGVELFDTEEMPIDYIQDIDYPQSVKAIIRALHTQRPDIPFIESAAANLKTIGDLKVYETTFRHSDIRTSKMYPSVMKYNVRDAKPYRITLAQALTPELNSFFNNGMIGVLSGLIVNGIIDGSPLPKIVTSEDKQWCEDVAINYLTKLNTGYMLDGQKANMVGIEHPFKEFSNQLIIGRVMKQILRTLNANRHLLDTPDLLGKLNDIVTREVIDKFKAIIDIKYKVYFKSEYNQKVGILTDEFIINGKRTIKIHDVLVRLVNN